ncbi:nuclear transport factor 2 family protein [Cryobacterium fucosi]|uniref:Nuclear transport factor 2 family protein n=1 Tax=Cryobacterium fucosi TaxID=1259157 RepID=A0A4R9BGM5_9MICO|nr:nuclear transport factor 2 family protein [Cryobacterium fucosi]
MPPSEPESAPAPLNVNFRTDPPRTPFPSLSTLGEAESSFQDALRRNDIVGSNGQLQEDVRFVGADGRTIDKGTDLAAHRFGSFAFSEVSALRREVQVFGSVGVTLVTLHLVGSARGAPLDAVLAYTRTWSRQGRSWIIVAAHGSAAPRGCGVEAHRPLCLGCLCPGGCPATRASMRPPPWAAHRGSLAPSSCRSPPGSAAGRLL